MRKLLYIFFLLPICLNARVNQSGDFQVWNDESIWIDLTEKTGLALSVEFRYGERASKLFFAYGQAMYIYKVTNWFYLSPSYRQERIRRISGAGWRNVYMPFLDALFFLPYIIYFEQRNRLEYRVREGLKNQWRYRNLINLSSRRDFTKLHMKPFISEEVFWTQRRGIDQNRFSVGISTHPHPIVQGNVYYMLRHSKRQNIWRYQNVLGISLATVF